MQGLFKSVSVHDANQHPHTVTYLRSALWLGLLHGRVWAAWFCQRVRIGTKLLLFCHLHVQKGTKGSLLYNLHVRKGTKGFLLYNLYLQKGTKGFLLYNLHVRKDTKGFLLNNLHVLIIGKLLL